MTGTRAELIGIVAGGVVALAVWLPICMALGGAADAGTLPLGVMVFVAFVGGWGCAAMFGFAGARVARRLAGES